MKLLFLVKFYSPFDRGGSEWSTHDLAKLLVERGHKVTVLTPNYGAKKEETLDGIIVKRFPFLKKLKNPKAEITPWWTNNIVWFLYTSLICTLLVKREKFDVIHVHSNEFLPATVIAGALTQTKTIATFRDYHIICSLGFCLWHKDEACSFSDFLKKDFEFFYQNYVNKKNILIYVLLKVAAVRARIMQKILYFFARRIIFQIAVSQKLSQIFKANGFKQLKVIHNPVIISAKLSKNTSSGIVFVGRLSKGKGVDMLLDAFLQISHKLPNVKLKIIGSGVLLQKLEQKIKISSTGSRVILTGQLSHNQVLAQIKKAALVVVPSIWPEPLPRSVIESLLLGIPVVATKRGGIAEIVINNRYGILASPNKKSLADATITAYKKRDLLHQNILKDLSYLRHHFSEEVANAYIQLYEKSPNDGNGL